MVVEKQMALVESMVAMQVEWSKMMFRPWWFARHPLGTANDFGRAVTAPAMRRVKANARRLRGR